MREVVNVVAEIRDNATGEVRECQTECTVDDGGLNVWSWSDGNFSCDCNRALFFLRAAGEPEPEDTACGDDAFAVRLRLPDGAIVYDEFEEAT